MKLALIRRRFSPTGGAELYLQRLLAALHQAGHELHIFAEAWEEPPPGANLHPQATAGSRAQRPLNFALSVRAELERHKFDCIFSLERTLRQDVYRAGDGVHRVWLQRRRQFAPWWKRPFVGFSAFHRTMLRLEARSFDAPNTRYVIANSEMVKREILQHFPFPEERIHLVRNGVDVLRFQNGQRKETRARLGVKPDEFLLLFVGSGWERKGLLYVLEAFHRLQLKSLTDGVIKGLEAGRRQFQQVRREVAGDLAGSTSAQESGARPDRVLGPHKFKLLVVGRGKQLRVPLANVIFAGPMADVENAYAAADLFLFLPIYEPSANVVFEALAAGLPVITSAQNGAAELIEECVNGTVIENPADAQAVLEAIAFWWSRRFRAPPVNAAALSLERNVAETVAILEMAAREHREQTL